MNKKSRGLVVMGVIFGLLVVAAGIILLLKSLGVQIDIDVWKFWPILVIVAGLGKIFDTKGKRNIWAGLVISTIGTLFLLNNIGQITFWFDDLWPILIIIFGISIIKHSFFHQNSKSSKCCGKDGEFKAFISKANNQNLDSDFFDISAFLGSAQNNYDQKNFKGGKVSGVLSGVELDLREAEMEGNTATINISAFMAGIEIFIPNNWKVNVEASSFLAGIDNKAKTTGNADKELFIKGSAFLSGIEIKN